MRRLSSTELDKIATRLQAIDVEEATLRAELEAQVDQFGFAPPRAEKSKRLLGDLFEFTLSTSQGTEIRDVEVQRIRELCPEGIFSQLFDTVTRYKMAKTATMLLAGPLPEDAPRNLRMLFHKAVVVKAGALRLRIEKLDADAAARDWIEQGIS